MPARSGWSAETLCRAGSLLGATSDELCAVKHRACVWGAVWVSVRVCERATERAADLHDANEGAPTHACMCSVALRSRAHTFRFYVVCAVLTVLFRSYDGLEKERKKISIRKIEIAWSEDRASSVPRSLSGPAPPCPPQFLIALHHFLAAAGCLPSFFRHGRRDRVSEGGVRPSGTPQVALWSARRMQIAPKLPLHLHSPSPPVRQVLGTNDEFAV